MSTLRLLSTGEWAIQAPGREPVRIVAGEVFALQFGAVMRQVRMEYRRGRWVAMSTNVKRAVLRNGMTAKFYDGRENFARLTK